MRRRVILSLAALAVAPALLARPVTWDFPRPQPQEGMPFADSRTGVLVWNGDGVLDITVGRGDWWEHRGGTPWLPNQSYTNIISLVELAMSFRTGVFAIRWPEGLVPKAKSIAAWDCMVGNETQPRVEAGWKGELYLYEANPGTQTVNFHPNAYVDITSVLEKKQDLKGRRVSNCKFHPLFL